MTAVPAVGDRVELTVCSELTRTQIVQFAAASGDFATLHVDEPAARAAGHPSVMGHGMFTMAATARAVTEWFGADALRTYSARFTAPVWPGDRLTTTAMVESIEAVGALGVARLHLQTTAAPDRVVLVGSATVAIDLDETHPNVATIRRLLAAFGAQDRAVITEILAPDCVWRVPGANALSGEHRGLPAIMRLFGLLKRVLDAPPRFDVADIAVSADDRVVLIQHVVIAINGRTHRFKECHVYRFAGGSVIEMDEYQDDQAAIDRAFSADAVAEALGR